MIFNQVSVDLQRITHLVENDLKMEIGRLMPSGDITNNQNNYSWHPLPKGCLKLNVDVGYKDNIAALAVLARNDAGLVQGLWFEKAHLGFVMEAEAKAFYNTCFIAKDQNYYKVIIESDYQLIVNANNKVLI